MSEKLSETSKRETQPQKHNQASGQSKNNSFRLKAKREFNDMLGFPGEGPEFKVASANVTAWNSFTRAFDSGKFPAADLICMQEH